VSEPNGFSVVVRQSPTGPEFYVSLLDERIAFTRGLVPQAIVGVLKRPPVVGQALKPEDFARNRVFVDYLHDFLKRELPKAPAMRVEARRQGKGWVYVIDRRTPTPAGEVPPHDIIGAVEVRDGELVPDSYQPNPNHVILSDRGLFQLDPQLHARLVEEVSAIKR
jgi:hypothetical protein